MGCEDIAKRKEADEVDHSGDDAEQRRKVFPQTRQI